MRAEASSATILQAGRKSEKASSQEADRRRWRRKGGEGRLAKGRISTGREKDDHFASWTVGSKKRGDGKPTAAGGGRREAKGAWQKGEMRAKASSATILQAGPLVRVQQGEPRRSKVRFAPILFFRKRKGAYSIF